jgi:DNA polymerase III subunit epsilon
MLGYQRAVDDRTAALLWAAEVVRDADAVFLDTETTGIGETAEVVDIAVVAGDGTVLLDLLVKPDGPIPIEASRVHGIYDADVRDAPPWKQVYPLLFEIIMQRRVVVYNASYDLGVISACCRKCGTHIPLSRWECAMQQYAAYVGEPSWHARGGYRWFKLDQAAHAFGIAPGGHRALADAQVCRKVVLGLAALAG